jgi:chemotaxis protein CheD
MKHQPALHDLAGRVARTLARPPAAPQARAVPPPVVGWSAARAGAEVSLMPGELWFGAEAASVRTLLGSCVALTLWHPRLRLGGMCHYLLPSRKRKGGEPLDGRYGDEAVLAMVNLLERHGCRSADFVAHLYGGADTMADSAGVKFNIGERNIERGWSLLDHFAFSLEGVDVGDNVPRTVTLTLATGTVECRRGNPQ